MQTTEREHIPPVISLWFQKYLIPAGRYLGLTPHQKTMLDDKVAGRDTATPRDIDNLFQKLFGAEARTGTTPADHMSFAEKKKLFDDLGQIAYLSKF